MGNIILVLSKLVNVRIYGRNVLTIMYKKSKLVKMIFLILRYKHVGNLIMIFGELKEKLDWLLQGLNKFVH